MTIDQQDQTHEADASDAAAKADWEKRIYDRSTDTADADPRIALPAVTGVRAEAAAGHVRLSWDALDGAAGYLVERTELPDGTATIVRHGGSDVPAVPTAEFGDTGLADGTRYRYRIGAVAAADQPAWAWSEPVEGSTSTGPAAPVRVHVNAAGDAGRIDRVWWMVGSERLTQLRFGDEGHGYEIGAEFSAALRRAHDDLGVTAVRAHAILHDDNAVVSRGADGALAFDFTVVDELYDHILALGVHPIVELGFMPAAIARDPGETVFGYHGIISPPQDWAEWRETVAALTAHLVERYGLDAVAGWGFEVWNEPNLAVFWTGTREEYFQLYREAAQAVKGVDARLLVGGPSSSAGEWVEPLAEFAADEGLPLDFVSSHTYGNMPVDVRPALARHGFGASPVWWTEWGVGSTHFGPIHDAVIGAPFVLSGYKAVQGRMAALSYWVVSDHFEELGRPKTFFHDGFGIQTLGNLRKPRYWAVHLAAHLGETALPAAVSGDGAEVLVQTWAARHDDGTLDVLVWNGTVNGELVDGDPRLDRDVEINLDGLTGSYAATLARVDETHSNVRHWLPADVDWPDAEQFAVLREHDRLDTEELADVTGDSTSVTVRIPMPGVARLRLVPRGTR